MSTVQARLCCQIVDTYFGDVCQKVAATLLAKGPLALQPLVQSAGLSSRQVREALFVLIHHNLVLHAEDGATTYRLDFEAVVNRLAYPVFVLLAEHRFGSQAGNVVFEVAKWGRVSVAEEWKPAVDHLLGAGLLRLVQPPAKDSPEKKRARIDDRQKYICLDIKAFHAAIRNRHLVEMAEKRINGAAASVLALVLGQRGCPTTMFQISQLLPPKVPLLIDAPSLAKSPLSHYLECMSQELSWFGKGGDQIGGQYSVDYPASALRLKLDYLISYISARFGLPSARIFRIVLEKKMLEEKSISKMSMITAKETRERLFALLKCGLLHLQEVPRSADYAPSRTIFLWTVPIPAAFHSHVERTTKSLQNLLERLSHERQRHSLLITKTERTDVAANAGLLSDSEQKQLASLRRILWRLEFQVVKLIQEYIVFKMHVDS